MPDQRMYRVALSISEPALCATAIYDRVYALNSLDATQQATDAAEREFGGTTWDTESVEIQS